MLNIQENVSLSGFTTFKIGGPAKFFVEVKNGDEMLEAIEYAKEKKLEVFILAGGSNVLISDKGFNGLVIRIANFKIETNDDEISCGVGVPLNQLVLESVKNDLTGLEWASGIPGTVGGAIIGNAGAFSGEIKDILKEVKALNLENNEVKIYKNSDCDFDYRDSIFKKNYGKIVLISAKFELEKVEGGDGMKKIEEIIRRRKDKQPQQPSAGSFFKNPIIEDLNIIKSFEKDTGLKMRDNKIPAGWFIESIGLKGRQVGGIKVSEKHANFLVNTGNASAEDVIMLSSLIKQKVRDEFGVHLEEEIRLVGF